jgi:hypothetical protein
MHEDELTRQPISENIAKPSRRRKLLPWWVTCFLWIFIAFLVMIPVAIVFGLLHRIFLISLLGFSTNDPFSIIGLCLMLLFTFKGIVAFGLWTEKKWAVGVAKIDALLSIVICCVAMILSIVGPNHGFNLRLELIAIIPYYIKMKNIQYTWENFDNAEQSAVIATRE